MLLRQWTQCFVHYVPVQYILIDLPLLVGTCDQFGECPFQRKRERERERERERDTTVRKSLSATEEQREDFYQRLEYFAKLGVEFSFPWNRERFLEDPE